MIVMVVDHCVNYVENRTVMDACLDTRKSANK